jgi:hypothetical protein
MLKFDDWFQKARSAPENSQFSDYELIQYYKSSYPETVEQPAEAPKEERYNRSMGEVATDAGASLARGLNSLISGAGHYIGLAGDALGIEGAMDNPWAKVAREWETKFQKDGVSPGLKARQEDVQARIGAAPDEFLAKAWSALKETASDPVVASNMLVEQVPMLAATAGGGKLLEAGGMLFGLGAKTVGKLGTAGAVGAGAALQGADVGADAYDRMLNLPDDVWEANPDFRSLVGELGRDGAKQRVATDLTKGVTAAAAAISDGAQFLPGGRTDERALVGAIRRLARGDQTGQWDKHTKVWDVTTNVEGRLQVGVRLPETE